MITSKTNAFIKEIKSLYDKKNRDCLGLYIIESLKLVKDAFISNVDIKSVICTENGAKFLNTDREIVIVSDEVFKSISAEVTPQGVMAIAFKKSEKPFGNQSSVFLDGVGDPANVGAIIRTAAASGYNDVFVTEDCADPFSPKSVRASMGGIFKVNVHFGNREELVDKIPLPFCVADMLGENIFNLKNISPLCLVIGNEGKGVSQIVKNKAKFTVSIPMENGMESLNAAVSAGVLMYALKNIK